MLTKFKWPTTCGLEIEIGSTWKGSNTVPLSARKEPDSSVFTWLRILRWSILRVFFKISRRNPPANAVIPTMQHHQTQKLVHVSAGFCESICQGLQVNQLQAFLWGFISWGLIHNPVELTFGALQKMTSRFLINDSMTQWLNDWCPEGLSLLSLVPKERSQQLSAETIHLKIFEVGFKKKRKKKGARKMSVQIVAIPQFHRRPIPWFFSLWESNRAKCSCGTCHWKYWLPRMVIDGDPKSIQIWFQQFECCEKLSEPIKKERPLVAAILQIGARSPCSGSRALGFYTLFSCSESRTLHHPEMALVHSFSVSRIKKLSQKEVQVVQTWTLLKFIKLTVHCQLCTWKLLRNETLAFSTLTTNATTHSTLNVVSKSSGRDNRVTFVQTSTGLFPKKVVSAAFPAATSTCSLMKSRMLLLGGSWHHPFHFRWSVQVKGGLCSWEKKN